MQLEVLKSKIHRARVTDADINYVGSITIDELLMEAVNLYEYEKVHVLNINNGKRSETYAIKGKKGRRDIIMNGALARMAQIGDILIILSYGLIEEPEMKTFHPKIIILDEKNTIIS
jgi:aspartate 1-decarboxylase